MAKTIGLYNLLGQVQLYISRNFTAAIGDDDKRTQLKYYIEQFIRDNGFTVEGIPDKDVIDRLYSEMAEYSILTKHLSDSAIEEVNINGWDDIAITYRDGRIEKTDEHFFSPRHATDIVKRLLHHSGMIIDNATPIAQGHLPGNIRVTALKDPIVDEDRGISVSIRMLHTQSVDRQYLLDTGALTEEMMSFLETCLRYGVSFVIAGRTSSGKTTLLNTLLGSVPDGKRIYTIESGARELDLVKRDKDGKVINNVVQTLSRPSDNPIYDVTQDSLVRTALRFTPDVICIGEMRDNEAHDAVEASSTDHTVITSVHGAGGRYAHMRIAFLCQRRFPIDISISIRQAAIAFPIVVFAHRLEDNSRKIMDITECVVHDDGELEYRVLYRYNIIGNEEVDGKVRIYGYFEKVNAPSDSLCDKLIRGGVPQDLLNKFTSGGDDK
ncbi:MAG: CpaF family protein [Clostridia bacterium]|nr:CpaF family protein [Clostridia bacterium]